MQKEDLDQGQEPFLAGVVKSTVVLSVDVGTRCQKPLYDLHMTFAACVSQCHVIITVNVRTCRQESVHDGQVAF